MSSRRLANALWLAPLVLSLALSACKKPEEKAAEAPAVLTVSTEAAAVRALPRTLELTGSVAAWDQMPVMPAANGLRIMQVLVDEGSIVKKGQLLAKLDDATLQAQLAAARARAASADAALAKMKSPTRRQDMVTAEAGVSQAEANYSAALDSYRRFQQLKTEGGVSDAELVGKEMAVESARAAAEQARQRLSLAREGSRSEDLSIASAQAAEARAAVAQMEAMLAQTRDVAPDDGQVIKRDAHIGDVSTVGRALFTMVRDRRLEVEAQVPETDLGLVKVGQSAKVTSDARPDLVATGKVREVSPALDTGNRQATVSIDLPVGSPYQVGMFVRAAVDLGHTDTLAVPTKAVVNGASGAQVFVLDGQNARARAIQAGTRTGGWVEVKDGLKPGEPVIVNGVGFLKDGDKVDVAPALTSSAPTSTTKE
jgi:HlyD family secretion protein